MLTVAFIFLFCLVFIHVNLSLGLYMGKHFKSNSYPGYTVENRTFLEQHVLKMCRGYAMKYRLGKSVYIDQ